MTSKIILSKQPCPSPECHSSDACFHYDDGHAYCYSCGTYFPPEGGSVLLDNFTYEYLPGRGITAETRRFYDVITKIDSEGKPLSDGFKYPNAAYKVRLLAKKEFYWQRNDIGDTGVGLFGRNKFEAGSHKYVTITEGEYDALSLYQVLRSPVVSVQSASSALRDCTHDLDWLQSFDRVYLCFDDDAAGKAALSAVAKLFDYSKVYHVKLVNRKDPNEYLQHGEAEELRNIWWNARKFLPEQVISSFSEFERILKEPLKLGVPYPFPTLTAMTYGIRTGESVLITAQEGVGKTEIMHAIEYNLLRETDDPIAAIFLEEPKRRHLQAIGGIHLQRPVHLPDCGVSDSEILKAVQDSVVRDERLHVYSHFGSDDPEIITDTIRFLVSARGCRYVLFDHISMAVSGLAGEDERRALDWLSTRLEMMVKELDFALIFVSHVNDAGQTRGSRYISKIADVRIDARRNVESEDPAERYITELTLSKNRFASKTGPAGRLIFNPTTYTLSELGAGDAFTPDELPKRKGPRVHFEDGDRGATELVLQ